MSALLTLFFALIGFGLGWYFGTKNSEDTVCHIIGRYFYKEGNIKERRRATKAIELIKKTSAVDSRLWLHQRYGS